jgi:hypothetical protein
MQAPAPLRPVAPAPRVAAPAPAAAPTPPEPTDTEEAQSQQEQEVPSLQEELRAWKQARGSNFVFPWRQVYLMASLCFGIASFVLPDSVNSNAGWLLWGLAAMSAYVWYSGRRKASVKGSAEP